MKFTPTKLSGLLIVEPEFKTDERGFFARSWCAGEMIENGLNPQLSQCSISFNAKVGTLRGLHYQDYPKPEDKLVRCTMGRIFDVAVDIRPDSDTYLEWFGIELSAENRLGLYIPRGFAHGFQTLCDGCEVFYMISEFYDPALSRGMRYDDPKIGVEWPVKGNIIISDRDLNFPLS
jgi:dTDP-4-dehydrorhamnose 3,5-epimerase